ncbi:hypothetical protein F5Y04DRAFT_244410 [Hypomontagnella monticulosa]|nr:hypothetical protein F5Y04DRAFT_244410 [Hypomontagnella monticulosa]
MCELYRNPDSRVVVLGAGIVGLQTALVLKDAGLDVVIVAKDFPGSEDPLYTSKWSGAQWRSNFDVGNQQDWDRQTFLHWLDLVKNATPEVLGLQLKKAVYLWDNIGEGKPEDSHWWTSFIPNFRVIPPAELANSQFDTGFEYETFAIWPVRYLEYLYGLCRERSVECRTAKVDSLAEVFSLEGLGNAIGLVNCTGVAAAKLVPDPLVFPVKGQTVVVSGLAERVATRCGDGWEAIVIPWPGTNKTMLGGSKIANDWSTDPDEQLTQIILDRCKPIAPELLNRDGEFEVLQVRVGLRPARHGGPRMELEHYQDKFICHAYGHYSAGYEGSVGISREILGLVEGYLGTFQGSE